MSLSTIIYIIIFLVIVVLIFKIIKKVIFAILTVALFITLLVVGIGTMAYLDYQDLSNMETFNVNILYGNPEEIEFGIKMPFVNKELVETQISNLDTSNIDQDFLDEVSDEEGNFYLVISKELFESLLTEDNTYYLQGTQDFGMQDFTLETGLTKQEALNVLESQKSADTYLNIILAKNDIPDLSALGISPEEIIGDELEKTLNGMELNQALFLSILADQDEETVIKLLSGFKEDELTVYPEKFSFKLLKLLPTKTLEGIILVDEAQSEEVSAN